MLRSHWLRSAFRGTLRISTWALKRATVSNEYPAILGFGRTANNKEHRHYPLDLRVLALLLLLLFPLLLAPSCPDPGQLLRDHLRGGRGGDLGVDHSALPHGNPSQVLQAQARSLLQELLQHKSSAVR